MKRLSLPETEDSKFLPSMIRDSMTDNLRFIMEHFHLYDECGDLIAKSLSHTQGRIVDIGSGAGGPILNIFRKLKGRSALKTKILLTDIFPNLEAGKRLSQESSGLIQYHSKPVDALKLPDKFQGTFTMFTALHHFNPSEVKEIFRNFQEKKQNILIFEGSERWFLGGLSLILIIPLFSLIFTPFIKPFKLSRLAFTYLIPVIPLLTLWDGIVSFFKLYTIKEINTFLPEKEDGYSWETGKLKNRFGINMVYVLGSVNTPDA